MKETFNKFVKIFSQYRDWLLVLLVVGGIGFFLQQIQAEQNKDPEAIWMQNYPDQVAPPMGIPGMIPDAGANEEGSVPVGSALDTFEKMPIEKIESVSYNPIFTPSEEFLTLLNRLKQYRADFQDAQDRGDIKTAIERLRRYVAEDPYGKRLDDWTTEPQELLRNLVCNELAQSLETNLNRGEEDRQAALAQADSEPERAIEAIREVRNHLDRTLHEVETNTDCLDDARLSADRIGSLRTLRDRVIEDSKNLEDRLVRQTYDRVIQQAGALGPNSLPDQVALTLQAIQDFRSLLQGMGPGALSQPQIDRLSEIEGSVQSNKESLINQVQLRIDQLAAEPDAEQNAEKVEEILRQFEILKQLGEPEARFAANRRKWDQAARKLEANVAVEKLQDLVAEIKSDLDQAETLKNSNQDLTPILKRVRNSITQFEQLRRNNKAVSSIPAFKNTISREFLAQKRRFEQMPTGGK